jgi:hypothetical protein
MHTILEVIDGNNNPVSPFSIDNKLALMVFERVSDQIHGADQTSFHAHLQ